MCIRDSHIAFTSFYFQIIILGWSEYRRAVVIREVFEVLFQLGSTNSEHSAIPEYKELFFCNPESDSALLPLTLQQAVKKNLADEDESATKNDESAENVSSKDQNNNGCSNDDEEDNDDNFKQSEIKYSRAFQALWTRTAPCEPLVILDDHSQVSLREYFERFPIEVHSPSNETLIVVDEKKYKARNILGFFRRGVQLVDYSKDTGSMVIDTISTVRNVSATSAVRKIPPGRISKLVHPELHLENYTNTITQVGFENTDGGHDQGNLSKPKARRRRMNKHRSLDGFNSSGVKEDKVKKRRKHSEKHKLEDDDDCKTTGMLSGLYASPPPVVEKLASIESICNAMKIESSSASTASNSLKTESVISAGVAFEDKRFSTPQPASLTSTAGVGNVAPFSQPFPVFTPPPITSPLDTGHGGAVNRMASQTSEGSNNSNYSVESLLPKEATTVNDLYSSNHNHNKLSTPVSNSFMQHHHHHSNRLMDAHAQQQQLFQDRLHDVAQLPVTSSSGGAYKLPANEAYHVHQHTQTIYGKIDCFYSFS